jgi:phosphoglycolate phosphatase
VTGALDALRAAGHRLGICTNKPEEPTLLVLELLGLARYFDVVVGGDTLAQKKPDPAPLAHAFAALGDGARLYVGDSEVDAETAQRAGVRFALYTEGYRKMPVETLAHDWRFADFTDLPGIVAAMSQTAPA